MSDELAALARRVEGALTAQAGCRVQVRGLKPLSGGACQEHFRIDAQFDSGPLAGEKTLVMRSDASRAPGSIDRTREYEVVRAATQAGVPTPQARWLTADLVRSGAAAYFLDWVQGEAIGRRVVKSPELAQARTKLPGELAQALARIHSVTPQHAPALPLPRDPRPSAEAHIGMLRRMLDELPTVHPTLELGLLWLGDHLPTPRPPTLVHGDFRTGNFIVGPHGLLAVLDWEFAHFGDPMEDLAWLCVRDWRFGQLNLPVGGFARREPFYAAYEAASGQRVDRRAVHFWEVFGNVRWAAGSLFQGERYLTGEDTDLELVAIPRRAPEMELEVLRLIEKGA